MAPKAVYSSEYKSILSKLKEARLKAGLNQAEVASKLSRPQSYLSKIESGERRIDVLEIKLLAQVYKKPVSFFFKNK